MMQHEEDKQALSDAALLRRFVREGRQAAFSQLVARYSRLVYSTCLRDTQNPAVAEDAAQAVFLLLARKAPALGGEGSLAGWLYQTARLVSRNAAQQETRARLREQRLGQYVAVEGPEGDAGNDLWDQLEPALHAALDALGRQEREAVLLRFYDDRSLKETGAALGLSEDAARMRVTRAVEKMRRHLVRAGVALPAAALAGLLTEKSVHAAPASFGRMAAPYAYQLARGVTKTMWITNAVIAGIVGISATGGVVGALHVEHPHVAMMAQKKPAPPVTPLRAMADRPIIRLPKNQQTLAGLAFIIKAQPAGSKIILAVISPPPLGKVVALLPTGTVFRGSVITLPGGTSAAIIKARSEAQYEADFLAATSTRDQLIAELKELPASATISMKEPDGKRVVFRGDTDGAIKFVQTLPSGTFVTAKVPTSTEHYPRIK